MDLTSYYQSGQIYQNAMSAHLLDLANINSLIFAAVDFSAGILIYLFSENKEFGILLILFGFSFSLFPASFNAMGLHRVGRSLIPLLGTLLIGISVLFLPQRAPESVLVFLFLGGVLPFFLFNSSEKVPFIFNLLVPLIFYYIYEYMLFLERWHEVSTVEIITKFMSILGPYVVITLNSFYFLLLSANRLKALEKAKAKISSLNKILVHDLSTPVGILDVSSKRVIKMRRGKIDGTQSEKWENRMTQSMIAVKEILASGMKMQKLSEGEFHSEEAVFSMDKALKSILQMLESRFEEKNVKLVFRGDMEGVSVQGDESLFKHEVIMNFLTNSLKFSNPGSKIIITGCKNKKLATLEIRDFGSGMPKEIREKVLSDTKPTSSVGTAGERGTGYGLLLAKSFVEHMGGNLNIESWSEEENNLVNGVSGTKITINLPVASNLSPSDSVA